MSLPAFKITYADDSTSFTSMAKHVTLADAKAYFEGQWFDRGIFPEEKMVRAVRAEEVQP
jgi:hypothetical protein